MEENNDLEKWNSDDLNDQRNETRCENENKQINETHITDDENNKGTKKKRKKKRYTETDTSRNNDVRKRRKRRSPKDTEYNLEDGPISTNVLFGFEIERSLHDSKVRTNKRREEHISNESEERVNDEQQLLLIGRLPKLPDENKEPSELYENYGRDCCDNNDKENETQKDPQDPKTERTGKSVNCEGVSSPLNDQEPRFIDENRNKKGKKKRKRISRLQKASSKVGILSEKVLPPLRGVDFTKKEEAHEVKSESTEVAIPKSPSKRKESDETEHFPEPIRLCKVITRYPMTSFLLLSLIHLITLATTLGLVFSGHTVFPLVFDDLPLSIYNDARLKDLAWRSKTRFDGVVYRPVYGYNVPSGYRSRIKDTVEVIYEKPGENILDQTFLSWIQTAENRLFENPMYKQYYCFLDYYYECVKPQSILRLFDGTYSHVDPVFTDANFSRVDNVVYKASLYNETRDFLDLFLGKDSSLNPGQIRTSITRSFFIMGWPLGYMSSGRRGTTSDLERFLVDVFKPEIENIRDYYLIERLDVYYMSKMLLEHDVVVQALEDIKLAIGSFLFIFVFMCFQTGSIFVTSVGILSILSSFLLTNLIYRYVFQYIYFGFFHVIAMFLILGIGADDLFVFYDTWRLTGHNKYPSDAHRLSDCYRKAAKTTFVTSLTTMTAFLVSGLSPLLPVKTFGIFAGLLVGINYIWVIIYFPTVIILHHTKIKNTWYAFHNLLLSICLAENMFRYKHRRRSVSSLTPSENNSARMLIDTFNGDDSEEKDSDCKTGNIPTVSQTVENFAHSDPQDNSVNEKQSEENRDYLNLTIKINQEDTHTGVILGTASSLNLDLKEIDAETRRNDILLDKQEKPKKNFEDRNRVVRFLKNGFYYFLTLRVVKVLFPLLLIGVSIFFIYSATLIQPDTNQLRLFRYDHNYAKASSRHYFSFKRNNDDEYQRLYLVWGMLPVDISQCNQKSAEWCPGIPVWDDAFNMNLPSSQTAFKDLCNRLENMTTATADKLRIRRDTISGKLQIHCFAKPFEQFFKKESEKTVYGSYHKYPPDMTLTLPVTSGNVTMLMNQHPYTYSTPLATNFDNYFEILVAFWMTNGYTTIATEDYFSFSNLLAERKIDNFTNEAYYSTSGLYYGTRLQYLAIEVNTTMDVYSLGYNEGLPVYEEWEKMMADINGDLPHQLQRGFQVTEALWHWLHVQETLVSSAITGIMVGLFSAWPILIFTTTNYIIGTLAVLTIGLVTACVVGMIPLVGWKLGVLESINLCMIVGLSVDYIVHLAEAYIMSPASRRLDRVRDMLESIGLSVISGAVTTMGAASFMLFAKIQFFYQFGIFLLSTIGISIVFSLLGFTTVMALCGPQGDTGSMKKLAMHILKCVKKQDTERQPKDIEPNHQKSCKCTSPSVLLDRLYDWLSYSRDDHSK